MYLRGSRVGFGFGVWGVCVPVWTINHPRTDVSLCRIPWSSKPERSWNLHVKEYGLALRELRCFGSRPLYQSGFGFLRTDFVACEITQFSEPDGL